MSDEVIAGEIVHVNGKNNSFEKALEWAEALPLDERAKLISRLMPSISDFVQPQITVNFGTNITNNNTSGSLLFQPGTSAEEISKTLPLSEEALMILLEAVAMRMRQTKEAKDSDRNQG